MRVAERVVSATAPGRAQAQLFSAQPVPFGSHLLVELSAAAAGPATLQLFDALGREVRRVALAPHPGPRQTELNTEALASGVYVLRLSSTAGTQQTRVVK